jgi:hypothetical protein
MQRTGVSAVTAYSAHREWATRPPDERFASVSALYEAACVRRARTEERTIENHQVRTAAETDDDLGRSMLSLEECRTAPGSLVSCLRSSFAKPADLVEDGVGRRGPREGLAVFVVMRQVTLDGGFEGSDVLEDPASDALRRDLGKESFDLIEPTRTRRREVEVV